MAEEQVEERFQAAGCLSLVFSAFLQPSTFLLACNDSEMDHTAHNILQGNIWVSKIYVLMAEC